MASTPVNDPFTDARSGFVKLDDMLGRLLLVIPTDIEERTSTLPGQQGKTYESITADVIILDGDPTDNIESLPMTLEGTYVSGQVIVAQLKAALKKNQREHGSGMVLGRLGKQKAQTKGFGDAWVLLEPTDEDKKIARGPANNYLTESSPFEGITS